MEKSDYLLNKDGPLIPASQKLPELTFKVFVLSIILAAFLAASNCYLALKIGTTISASIPASVMALGILRFFKNSNVLETNIIQTAASGGEGVASAVAYTLPALIILHIWTSFPYWETALVTGLGGILGVFFSVPLRRVMLNLPSLRFPEGTAIGNVLKASAERGDQMKILAKGGTIGALLSFAQGGLQVVGSQMNLWFTTGGSILGLNLGFLPAPLAAGFIVGIEAGSSILLGLIVGWLIILPILVMQSGGYSGGHSVYEFAMQIWSSKLRFVGVGVMLVGGVWTLVRLLRPVIEGIRLSISSVRKAGKGQAQKPLRTEHDIPFPVVVIGSLISIVLIFFVVFGFLHDMHLLLSPGRIWAIAIISTLFIAIVGFLLATICGYFTGLIGSTNNPLSGILILGLIALGVIYMFLVPPSLTGHEGKVMILIAAIIATVASISNENLQDLKAGQMVGATPWKQQFILVVGVVVAALVVGPVFEVLFHAYGIGGVFPRAGMDPSHMLAAPQAGLMAAIAKGLRTHHLPWAMIYIGGGFAVLCIILDEFLKVKYNLRLAVLAVGLGVYLPPEITTPLVAGGLLNLAVRRSIARSRKAKDAEMTEEKTKKMQSGTLLCCGLVAGAAIMGVLLAIPFVMLGSADALSIVPISFAPLANIIGLIAAASMVIWIYRTSMVKRRKTD